MTRSMTPVLLRLPPDQAKRLKVLQAKGLTVSAWMRRIVGENLEKAEKAMEAMS
jgi:predicted DNA-binding protein